MIGDQEWEASLAARSQQAREAWRASVRRIVRRTLVFLGVLGVVAALASPAPYVIEMPGPTFNALATMDGRDIISIDGAKTYEGEGNFDVLTVQTRGGPGALPSWFEVFWAQLSPENEVVEYSKIYPVGVTKEEQK